MSTRDWHGVQKRRQAQRERSAHQPPEVVPFRRSSLPETHTEPNPAMEITDSRGQPITLPRVSILEREKA